MILDSFFLRGWNRYSIAIKSWDKSVLLNKSNQSWMRKWLCQCHFSNKLSSLSTSNFTWSVISLILIKTSHNHCSKALQYLCHLTLLISQDHTSRRSIKLLFSTQQTQNHEGFLLPGTARIEYMLPYEIDNAQHPGGQATEIDIWVCSHNKKMN